MGQHSCAVYSTVALQWERKFRVKIWQMTGNMHAPIVPVWVSLDFLSQDIQIRLKSTM